MRDAALLASGKCAASFPEQCRASLPELYKLWTAHLDDNIPSVRADAAAALGDAIQAYRQELLELLLPLIRQGFSLLVHGMAREASEIMRMIGMTPEAIHLGVSCLNYIPVLLRRLRI